MFIKRVAIALGALLLVSSVVLAQVTVSLPTATYSAGSTQAIPITVGDLTGQAAISFQTTVTYDKAILKFTGISTTGTPMWASRAWWCSQKSESPKSGVQFFTQYQYL